ncbi:Zona pellucida sperm-binding protein 3 [Merluccius polli]|uniref:Zona pellucida sperm-binding protein 3 n=1 Tax=Merluccius polli TaxID=89951 RepID=A0AA47N5Z4_MERPO|nr:Zona pellucida sperm-binding protein 3 [Merluccius polli]
MSTKCDSTNTTKHGKASRSNSSSSSPPPAVARLTHAQIHSDAGNPTVAMKTNSHIHILWAVIISLSIANYVAGTHQSPSARRPARRKMTVKLNARQTTRHAEPTISMATTPSGEIPSSPQPQPIPGFRAPGSQGPRGQPYFAYYRPDVSITCSTSDFVVRVKTAFYGLGANAEELRLGSTCRSNGVLGPYGDLLFAFRITECDVQREVSPDYIVYKYVLCYTPSPNRPAKSFHVSLECRYPRYHHVYRLAVRPTWQTAIVRKILRGRSNKFQMQLMDDSWNMPVKSQIYVLGQIVHLQVSASPLVSGAKVYISSCFATPYNSSTSPIKYTLIENFGCMLVSQTDPVGSQFVSQDNQTLRFSLSAFQFTSDPNTQVQIQCKLHVSSEGPSAVYKACTYKDSRSVSFHSKIPSTNDRFSSVANVMSTSSADSGPILVSYQPPTSEDHFPSATPPLISTTAVGELEDTLTLQTQMNQPITEQGSPTNLANTSHLSKTSGEEDQQSSTDSEEDEEVDKDEDVEKQLEGDGSVWVESAKAIGQLKTLGVGSGLITKEWEGEMSGMGDLDEFGKDGGLQYRVTEGLLEMEEKDELGSRDSSETKENVRKAEAHKFSGERLGHSRLEKEKVESPVTVAQREMPASEKGTTHWAKGGRKEPTQDGGTREMHGGRGEEVEWENDKAAQGDGLVETDIVGDKEMTWYFTWR